MALHLSVHGVPAPQGSKRGIVVGGRARVVESSARVKPWRSAVVSAVRDELERLGVVDTWEPLSGPVFVGVDFYMPATQESRRRSWRWSFRRPDLDKLLRSTLDGLTDAGAFGDDAQVAHIDARKCYVGERGITGAPGASIHVESLA